MSVQLSRTAVASPRGQAIALPCIVRKGKAASFGSARQAQEKRRLSHQLTSRQRSARADMFKHQQRTTCLSSLSPSSSSSYKDTWPSIFSVKSILLMSRTEELKWNVFQAHVQVLDFVNWSLKPKIIINKIMEVFPYIFLSLNCYNSFSLFFTLQ